MTSWCWFSKKINYQIFIFLQVNAIFLIKIHQLVPFLFLLKKKVLQFGMKFPWGCFPKSLLFEFSKSNGFGVLYESLLFCLSKIFKISEIRDWFLLKRISGVGKQNFIIFDTLEADYFPKFQFSIPSANIHKFGELKFALSRAGKFCNL